MRHKFLVASMVSMVTFVCHAAMSGSLSEAAIIKRMQPPAAVTTSGAVAPAPVVALAPGEKTFKSVCSTCHNDGLLGAPKFGNKDDWQKRIAQGMDVLYVHAIKGFKAMPPKGGCGTCSDEDIHQAIQFMVSHSQ